MVALLGIADDIHRFQPFLLPAIAVGFVCQLWCSIDGVELLSDIVVVIKSVDHTIDSILGLLNELVIVLRCLRCVHILCCVEEIRQILSDYLLLCLVNAHFAQVFQRLVLILKETFYPAYSVRPDAVFFIECIWEYFELDHRRVSWTLVVRLLSHWDHTVPSVMRLSQVA